MGQRNKRNLTYCISTSFGEKYDTVVAAMHDAAKAWSDASDVRFIHSSWLDPLCNENTTDVIFDVRPVDVNGQYLARAFSQDTKDYNEMFLSINQR